MDNTTPPESATPQRETHSPNHIFNLTLDDDDIVFEHITPVNGSASRMTSYEKVVKTLPLPPILWNNFQRACQKEASSKQLGEIIKDDPVLSASILRIANAPGLGVHKELTDIGRAVAHLGTTLVRTIVSRHAFSGSLSSGKAYDIYKLWQHGMAVSSFAEVVADHIPGCHIDDASTLGLFHDIGKMSFNLFTEYMVPAKLKINEGHLLYEYERFSCTHIDMGVLLAKHWKLPERIIEGIRYHHHPAYTSADMIPENIRKEVFAVYLADQLAIRLGFDTGDSGITLPDESFAPLMPKTTLVEIMESKKIQTEVERIKSIVF